VSATTTTPSVSQKKLHCSFCRKSSEEVKYLVAGPNNIHICEECVDKARKIIEEAQQTVKTEN
jgi:ATP-dependent Clp protease ATP-binding subunit ClpX